MTESRTFCIVGAGAWGTALACAAVRAGHHATVLARRADVANEIVSQHTNERYLKGIALEPTLAATTDAALALAGADRIVLAVPAQVLDDVLADCAPHVDDNAVLINTAKGIYQGTGELLSHVIARHAPANDQAMLSGPSFAIDVAQNRPIAVTIAADSLGLAGQIASEFSSGRFRCYNSSDLVGVQLGGALKNVMAIASGIAGGLGLGESAQFALVTRGLNELRRMGTAMGASEATLVGLSGLGDLMLSCSSSTSRNYSYGYALATGQDMTDRPLAEGIFTCSVAHRLAQEQSLDMPIVAAVARVLDGELSPEQAVESLLGRPLRTEGA